ncbi:MAG: ThuA domain-containing protein [Planctomycetaceae bacterium]|nr:ThuA domain-containing protein [Planctomycetaceae bacterium]
MTRILSRSLTGLALLLICLSFVDASRAAESDALELLFLGDNGHHRPAVFFQQLAPVLKQRGVALTYTDDMNSLQPDTLNKYDGLIVYANIDEIAPAQAAALLKFVESGKGFVPLHCATYCFRNAPEIVALMGAQFKRHGAGDFATQIPATEHPIMKGFHGFTSWDESYIHHLHNEANRTVLEYRVEGPQEEGSAREPWTWIRTHGAGRVFYTAWGHDERTWGQAGFQNLLERGIRWACGDDLSKVPGFVDANRFEAPEMTALRTDVKPFDYIDVGPKIPNYTPGAKWGVQGDPRTEMQLPLSAEESIKHYVTPVDFEMQLFASEPDLGGKPIAMNWDERGRLWVCETYDYPNELQPAGKGRDRIRICEDTDGDGRADKFTVFAEQLSIPTAIVISHGGAVVQNGVETLFLKDTDGDDKADVRKVLISNWAFGDTHGGVSNFQYGMDNWIWAMQGYNNSTPVIEGVEQQSFRMGFFRFRLSNTDMLRVTDLEFVRSTNNNTWGLGFSEEGLVFGSTANHNPSVYMPIANRYYEQVRGWSPEQLGSIADTYLFKPITDRIRQVDQFGGYTAGAGHALYTARTYPSTWWNRTAFVCGPTGHLVGTFELRRDGADFHSTSPCNLVASDDEWSAPIMAEVGPDGNVWVLDWYNYIVQHNPTPHGFETGKGNAYESDLRDKKHGRIYRVAYKGDQGQQDATVAPSLPSASPSELVATLRHPTMLWRKQAQRLLVERGKLDVVPELIALVGDNSVDSIGLNVGAMHALWTLKGLDALDDTSAEGFKAVIQALGHPSAGVRRNAVAVLPSSEVSSMAIVSLGPLRDTDPHVRLAAALALADMPEYDDAGAAIAEFVCEPTNVADRWIADALTSAAAAQATPFLLSLADSSAGRKDKSDALGGKALPIATIVAEHLARGKADAESIEAIVAGLANSDPRLIGAVLDGFAKGWPQSHRLKISTEAEESLVALLERAPSGSKGQLLQLASLWGSKELEKHAGAIVKALLETASDSTISAKERAAAANQLIRFRADDDAVVTSLLALVTPQTAPELAVQLIESLTASTASKTGIALVELASQTTPALRDDALRVLLSRPQTTTALLDGIESGQISLADLKLDQKQALSNHPDKQIQVRARKLLAASGGLPNPDREKVLHEKLPLVKRSGDVVLGKAVFKKQCAKCHKHSGEGENIGPDLTGMAVHPKTELLTHILDPSRSVEGNFRIYTIVTDAGRVLTGMLASETRTSLELIDAEAKRHAIQRSEIDELISSRKSLMPEGFEKQVPDEDIVNLLEFLTAKGRFVALDLRKVATSVSTRGMFVNEDTMAEALIFPDWTPKNFAGVPFQLVDPQGTRVPNAVLLYGPNGKFPPDMPKQVALPVNTSAKAIHMLSGVSGWGSPFGEQGSVSMIVRLRYADGKSEDHELKNGIHFADYIRRVDVPESEFAFDLRGKQIRYLVVQPQRDAVIEELQLVKGPDSTAPVVMAITVETPNRVGEH